MKRMPLKYYMLGLVTLGLLVGSSLPVENATAVRTRVTDAANYGAVAGDGRDDTAGILAAIKACRDSADKTLLIGGGTYHLGSITFPPEIQVEITPGGRLEIRKGAALRFNGPFQAPRTHVFSGEGLARFGSGALSEVFPQWWGASPRSTDCSPAINKAIRSAPDLPGIMVRLSGLFNCQTTIHVNRHRVRLQGDGTYATQLTFNPVRPASLFKFAHDDKSVIAQCALRDLGMVAQGRYADTSRVKKVGIQVVDADIIEIRNIAIHNWGGSGSIGLHVQGRELVFVENITVLADLPILIDKNPEIDWISIDHSTFRNTYLLPMDPNGPSVKIASGVALHNVVFDGTNAWVKGKYGLFWEDRESKGVSMNLSIKNVRMENGTAHGGAMIHIDHNYNLMNLVIENVYGCGGGVGGLFLRRCTNVTTSNLFYTPVRGQAPADYVPTALDIDETSANLVFINTYLSGRSHVRTGKLIKTFGSHTNPAKFGNRVIESYDRPGNDQGEGLVLYGTKTWSHNGTLADGARQSLPVGARNRTRVATVTVSASDGADINESAQFMVGGHGKTIRVWGTDRTAAVPEAGKLSLVGGETVRIDNQLGKEIDLVVTVFWR